MPTLTVPKLLKGTIAGFKKRAPFLKAMSTDFTAEPLTLGNTITGHIRILPTASTYDANNGGYKAGANEGRSLLVDIPLKVDNHKHVTLKWSHLNSIADEKDSLEQALDDAGYVLAKAMADSVLAKAHSGNLSYSVTESAANVDRDTLGAARKLMNSNGAAVTGRVVLGSSDFCETLDADPRIASRDYYAQQTEGDALLHLRNVAGFRDVWEYPDLPANPVTGSVVVATAATNILTPVGDVPPPGSKVRFTTTTTLPGGLSAATTYYVLAGTAATNFKVSATYNGTEIDITDTGTGTHSFAGYENIQAIAFEPRLIALTTGIPDHTFDVAAKLGIPKIASAEVMTDPDTGFTLMAISWMEVGTFDLYVTIVSLWGSAVGRQNGTGGAITDKAGVRFITA